MMKIESSRRIHPSLRNPGELEPNWVYFVALSSDEGLRWVEEYSRPENVELTVGTTESLQLLRKRKVGPGRELLARLEIDLKAAAQRSPSVVHVLGRWYYGALAYYHYLLEDFEEAAKVLALAQHEVRQAVEENRVLLPFAAHCLDFRIQHIRILRNQRRWPEMRQRIEQAREIATGLRPYCVLSDGSAVDVPAIQRFYRAIPDLTGKERESLDLMLDDHFQLGLFGRTIQEIFAMPGFVIPYSASRRAA